MLAGVPLVGKTTLARHLARELDTRTLHIENDRLRALVLDAMGRADPRFDEEEDQATYEAARHLIELGVEQGLHVVHDATNIREADRNRTYQLAEELDAPVRVVFVHAPERVLENRARQEGPAAQRALDALGDRRPRPTPNTRPHTVLDGTRNPEASVQALLDADAFAPLHEDHDP